MAALAPEGRLVLLGTGKTALSLQPGPLVAGERSILGSITGSPFENEKALGFSVLANVRPKIETLPLDRAAEAIEGLKSGDVKFRLVLTMR
jgi:alcohol dehydrogenase